MASGTNTTRDTLKSRFQYPEQAKGKKSKTDLPPKAKGKSKGKAKGK